MTVISACVIEVVTIESVQAAAQHIRPHESAIVLVGDADAIGTELEAAWCRHGRDRARSRAARRRAGDRRPGSARAARRGADRPAPRAPRSRTPRSTRCPPTSSRVRRLPRAPSPCGPLPLTETFREDGQCLLVRRVVAPRRSQHRHRVVPLVPAVGPAKVAGKDRSLMCVALPRPTENPSDGRGLESDFVCEVGRSERSVLHEGPPRGNGEPALSSLVGRSSSQCCLGSTKPDVDEHSQGNGWYQHQWARYVEVDLRGAAESPYRTNQTVAMSERFVMPTIIRYRKRLSMA